MTISWPVSPWVEARRDNVGFALQAFPNDTPVDPCRHLLAEDEAAPLLPRGDSAPRFRPLA